MPEQIRSFQDFRKAAAGGVMSDANSYIGAINASIKIVDYHYRAEFVRLETEYASYVEKHDVAWGDWADVQEELEAEREKLKELKRKVQAANAELEEARKELQQVQRQRADCSKELAGMRLRLSTGQQGGAATATGAADATAAAPTAAEQVAAQ